MKPIAERYHAEFCEPSCSDETANKSCHWLEQQPENSKMFTIDQLHAACLEAYSRKRDDTIWYDEITTDFDYWFQQYKAKIMGEKV